MAVKIHCIADVCLLPIGTQTPSVSDYVTAAEKLIRESGLKSTLHSAGTTIEGEWSEVMDLIGRMHEKVHEMGVLRIQSDIRVGTRTDKSQTAKDKVDTVERKLKGL
ncbi:DEKNAAC104885 [Brettanomyces naardenensis]|uniref:DEKNAAC104886 n=1 Tax=Brettanomyces naardenensis TaxID=13370 RepID=A0A448YS22_BRENA|nr:DEKNAAC104885 [Brettanomyces naardenensis]